MEDYSLHTSIEKSVQTVLGTLILEQPNGYPRYESNLYLVGVSGKILWKAEKPDPNTLYSRMRLNNNETISAYTIGSHACDLELKTGKLIGFSKIT